MLLPSERDGEVVEVSRAVAAARAKNDKAHDAKRRRVEARTKPRINVELGNVPVWFAPSLGADLLAACRNKLTSADCERDNEGRHAAVVFVVHDPSEAGYHTRLVTALLLGGDRRLQVLVVERQAMRVDRLQDLGQQEANLRVGQIRCKISGFIEHFGQVLRELSCLVQRIVS